MTMDSVVPAYLSPPADWPIYRSAMAKDEVLKSIHIDLGVRWYHTALPARETARLLSESMGEIHLVVALDYGNVRRIQGVVRREAILNYEGEVVACKMFRVFTIPALASFLDAVRLSPCYGPSCLTLYEEVNVDRPRRLGLDLECEFEHRRKNGDMDHKERAIALWPEDYRTVATTPELFLRRILVDRVLPALKKLTGVHLTTKDLYILDSSCEGKLSFHLVTPVVLATADDVWRFGNWMRDTFENGDKPLTPLLDCGVYSSCGNMRLPLNRKPAKPGAAKDKPWLRPTSRVGDLEFAQTHDAATPGDPHEYTLALLRQHMWSCVEPHYPCFSERLAAWAGESGSQRKPPGAQQQSTALATGVRSSGKRSAAPVAAVPSAVLDIVGRHLGVPSSEVTVASASGSPPTASSDGEAPATFTGRLTCVANGTGASVGVFVSQRGNVYADTGDGADIATNLVERALSSARADSFSDWFRVGGALHGIDSARLFDVWDYFSQKSDGKYPGRDNLMKRWGQFNGAHSLGTLVFMAREDNAEETSAILRANRSLLLGQLGGDEFEAVPPPTGGLRPPHPRPLLEGGNGGRSPPAASAASQKIASLERRVLLAVLGDNASEPIIATGAASWNGSWCAPSGRRCVHGKVHFDETTFETFIAATRPCSATGCDGQIGGGFWSYRDKCGKCKRTDATTTDAALTSGGLKGSKKHPMVLYEACHGCGVQSDPVYVGRLDATPDRKNSISLPTAMNVYADALAKSHPSWEVTPCAPSNAPVNTSRYKFTALFTVTEGGRRVHEDGFRRLLGVTTDGDIVLGVKAKENKAAPVKSEFGFRIRFTTDSSPVYSWKSVAPWFRDALTVWFRSTHAAAVSRLPEPSITIEGVSLWTLPCCAVTERCGRPFRKCRTVTDAPWRYLRQMKSHGVLN